VQFSLYSSCDMVLAEPVVIGNNALFCDLQVYSFVHTYIYITVLNATFIVVLIYLIYNMFGPSSVVCYLC
jgi:hypothetical protein